MNKKQISNKTPGTPSPGLPNALGDEALNQLPLSFRFLEKQKTGDREKIEKAGHSVFHNTPFYTFHGFYKPVSKLLIPGK